MESQGLGGRYTQDWAGWGGAVLRLSNLPTRPRPHLGQGLILPPGSCRGSSRWRDAGSPEISLWVGPIPPRSSLTCLPPPLCVSAGFPGECHVISRQVWGPREGGLRPGVQEERTWREALLPASCTPTARHPPGSQALAHHPLPRRLRWQRV